MESLPQNRLDKTVVSIANLEDADDEKAYWLAKSPQERLQAVELIRQTIYGYTAASARFQRVFEVAQQKRR